MPPQKRPPRRPPVANPTGRSLRRVPWGTISREQVVDAATEVVKAGGYPEMTIRSIANLLGVAPMSLYRHVRDKDDLLEEVVDRLLARTWQPRASKIDWQAWVSEAADRLRNFLVSQPAALHIYLLHPVVSPAAIARMEAMLDALRAAGLDELAARQAYATIHTYTIGFAALEASRARWGARPWDPSGWVAHREIRRPRARRSRSWAGWRQRRGQPGEGAQFRARTQRAFAAPPSAPVRSPCARFCGSIPGPRPPAQSGRPMVGCGRGKRRGRACHFEAT